MKIFGAKFKGNIDKDGLHLTFTTREIAKVQKFFSENDVSEEYTIEIKKPQKKRSLDSNSYAWVLMDKIAKIQRTTAQEIYREIITRVGVFTNIAVKQEDVESIIHDWESKGEGWVAIETAVLRNQMHVLKMYKGSSVYTQKEMNRLIDEIVDEAKEQGIPVISDNEIKEMVERW